MPDRPRNMGASVRQRLLNLAHARSQPMELLLTRYALERLLHRLSLSPHRERFVLKGAMLRPCHEASAASHRCSSTCPRTSTANWGSWCLTVNPSASR